jgi:glycopeptide antibiotics resistance protein
VLDGTVLFVVGVPALAACVVLLVRRGSTLTHALLWAGVGLYAIAAVDRLFFPVAIDSAVRAVTAAHAAGSTRTNLVPLLTVAQLVRRSSSYQAVRQIGGNVGLLLPLGAVLPILVVRLRRLGTFALTALAATLAIEVVQYMATGAGFMSRAFDIDDVLLNVAGALIGYCIWWALSGRRLATEADAPAAVGAAPEVAYPPPDRPA